MNTQVPIFMPHMDRFLMIYQILENKHPDGNKEERDKSHNELMNMDFGELMLELNKGESK